MRALNNTGLTIGDLALAFTLVAALVFGVISCASFLHYVATQSSAEPVSRTHYGVSFMHDDHLWFRAFGGSALHHPDCPCGGG
jgi:hypothetical protein